MNVEIKAETVKAETATQWITTQDAAKRGAFPSLIAFISWVRRFEAAHPDVQLRRTRGRIHSQDLINALQVASDTARTKRKRRATAASTADA